MSARASGYMKALVVCPNGERITPREKLVGMVLADSHQDRAKSFTYPSVETIAEESVCDKRTCQRYLAALEHKGVIRRLRPSNQGRSATVFYFFAALDEIPEGWQDATLFDGPIFAQKGGGRVAEGWQKGGNSHPAPNGARAGTGTKATRATKATTPQPPQAGACGFDLTEGSDDASKTKDCPASVEVNCVPVHASKPEPEKCVLYDQPGFRTCELDKRAIPERVSRTSGALGNPECELERSIDLAADEGMSEVPFTVEQLAHLAKHADDPEWTRKWTGYYRELNQAEVAGAEAAAKVKRGEAERIERLKAELATVPAARAWVMRQCGLPESKRKRRCGIEQVIESVLELDLEEGTPLWKTAPKMAEARKKFVANGEFIKVPWGPVNFYKMGIWRDERGWAWNQEKLERLQGASVGSAR